MRMLVAFAALGLGLSTQATQQIDSQADSLQVDRPPGMMITLKPGESFPHNVHILCRGSGSPTIVLESGIGASALQWWQVQHEVEKEFRVCAYDRAGYGWSAPGSASRTVDKLVEELHATLKGADVRPPYVLAGHSFGGLIAQYFAAVHAKEVAGLVLVDSSHANQPNMLETDDTTAGKITNPVAHNPDLERSGVPQTPAEIASFLNSRRTAIFTQMDEIKSFPTSADMMRPLRLPDRPLTVISRGRRAWPTGAVGDAREKHWAELQADLVKHSSNARHVMALKSRHDIPAEEPHLVATEIIALARTVAADSAPTTSH